MRFLTWLRFCLALLLFLPMGELEAQTLVDAPKFRTKVQMVLVPITVTDRKGKTIEGLGAEDFDIFDDKMPQKIIAFSNEDAPSSVGLVLDVSGSMQETLSSAKEIAQAFFGSSNPEDEFLLLTVSTQPAASPKFTTDIAALEETIGYINPGGLTALIDTVYFGLSRMREAECPRRALLIISDGIDNHSRYSARDLMRVAIEADVQIYTIIVDNGPAAASNNTIPYRPSMMKKPWDDARDRQGPEMLEKLSEQTGGLHFRVANNAEAKEAVMKAGRALRNEYVIAYRPSDSGTPGRRHRIRVKSNVTNMNIHARNSYYSR